MIIVAPTSYKGTHSAADAARAMARAARELSADVLELPVSDGGPGLLDALRHSGNGVLHEAQVSGPLGEPVTARILVQDDVAIIESADACGLHLVPVSQRDPINATTFGVGELILAAASYAPHVIVGLGGSATIDGGAGAALSLLYQKLPRITALADVKNPLVGPNGAVRVYGPQKGATAEQLEILEARMEDFADRVRDALGIDVASMPGGGAAGGLAAGLHAFAGAEIVAGSQWVIERLGIEGLMERATALVTGEGRYDEQSAMGKITGTLVQLAEQRGIPALVVAGEPGGEVLTLDDLAARTRIGLAGLLGG